MMSLRRSLEIAFHLSSGVMSGATDADRSRDGPPYDFELDSFRLMTVE